MTPPRVYFQNVRCGGGFFRTCRTTKRLQGFLLGGVVGNEEREGGKGRNSRLFQVRRESEIGEKGTKTHFKEGWIGNVGRRVPEADIGGRTDIKMKSLKGPFKAVGRRGLVTVLGRMLSKKRERNGVGYVKRNVYILGFRKVTVCSDRVAWVGLQVGFL